MSIDTAIKELVQGVTLIGNAVNYFIRFIFLSIGVDVPDVYVRTATIIVVILALWRFSATLSKVVVFALILLLVSQAAGFLTPLLGMKLW
jgi:hypothetical protein